MGAHPLYGALSQWGLLDQFSMLAVLVTVPTVMQNLLFLPLAVAETTATTYRAYYWRMSTSSTNARHLLHCMVQRTITEADAPTIHLNATRSKLSVPPPPSSPIFMPNALSAAPPPVIEWCWLAYPVAWLSVLRVCGRNFNLIWIDVPITFSSMQSHKLVEEIVCQWVYISWL